MRAAFAILLLLLGACNGDGFYQCKVTCPGGTRCEADRCLPVCDPACGADEHCGADRVCHPGAAPDGAITVPPVDAGARADGARDGGAPADGATKPDGDPLAALCACLAQQPRTSACAKQQVTCSSAPECCAPWSPLPCMTYGNSYACAAGKCQPQGCASAAECVTYATTLKLPGAAAYTCHPASCPGTRDTCAPATKSCGKDTDCCDPSSKVPCGVYPNHWSCAGGSCQSRGCLSGAECTQYAQAMGLPDAAGYTCRPYACLDTRYCAPPGKPCSVPADCCTPGSTIPCGTYGNRYRCESSECVLDSCSGSHDCLAYASALGLPDAADYNCVSF